MITPTSLQAAMNRSFHYESNVTAAESKTYKICSSLQNNSYYKIGIRTTNQCIIAEIIGNKIITLSSGSSSSSDFYIKVDSNNLYIKGITGNIIVDIESISDNFAISISEETTNTEFTNSQKYAFNKLYYPGDDVFDTSNITFASATITNLAVENLKYKRNEFKIGNWKFIEDNNSITASYEVSQES